MWRCYKHFGWTCLFHLQSICAPKQEPAGSSEGQIYYPDWTMSHPRRSSSNFLWIPGRSVGSLINMRGVGLASDVCRKRKKNNVYNVTFSLSWLWPNREPSDWSYNQATLFLEDINTGTWPSRLGESRIWDSKIWSWVPRDSGLRMTALARTGIKSKRQTHPVVTDVT
jgi:hypothetical protein